MSHYMVKNTRREHRPRTGPMSATEHRFTGPGIRPVGVCMTLVPVHAELVRALLDEAYRAGQRDAQASMRAALGVEP